jgi:hypothetical protein
MLRQLYLPYSNFRRSVACYSNSLLLETLKTFRQSRRMVQARVDYDIPDEFYYIWREWAGHYQAFSRLAVMCYEEGLSRSLPVSRTRMRAAKDQISGSWTKPHWVGWAERHARHRANLRVIGAGENLGLRICVWRKWELDARLEGVRRCIKRYYPQLHWYSLDVGSIFNLHSILDELNAPRYYGNHYEQFEWSEEPTHTYLRVPTSRRYVVC